MPGHCHFTHHGYNQRTADRLAIETHRPGGSQDPTPAGEVRPGAVRLGAPAVRRPAAPPPDFNVSEGFSLKEIGDHLGHRSSSATRIYAKVDLQSLREVAAFNFGGVKMQAALWPPIEG